MTIKIQKPIINNSDSFLKRKLILLGVLIFVLLIPVDAQTIANTDSLELSLSELKSDTNKLRTLHNLFWGYLGKDFDKAIEYAKQQKQLSKAVKNLDWESKASNNIGVGNLYSGNYDTSLIFFNEAIALCQKTGNKKQLALIINNIGIVYLYKGEFEKALPQYLKSIKLNEELNDSAGIGMALVNIAIVYENMGKYDLALQKHKEALILYTRLNQEVRVGYAHNNIATLLIYKKQFNDAIPYLTEAINILKKYNDFKFIAQAYNNMAGAHEGLKDYNKMLKFHLKSLEMREKLNDEQGLVESYNNVGLANYHLKNYKQALFYNAKGEAIGKKIGYNVGLKNIYTLYANIYESIGDYKNAFYYQSQLTEIKDTLLNSDITRQLSEMEEKYKSEKKELQIKSLRTEKEAQKRINEVESKRKNLILIFITLGLVVILIFLFFLYSRFKVIRNQNVIIECQKKEVDQAFEELEEKNKEIMDSINYAKRIQSAILPPNKLVKEYLKDSFILYKPKDIVAGDFYWMEHKDGKVLFAAADCTGHGVPGAMVSVVCNNGLNRSVREYGLTDPGKILDKTREIVIQEFEKSEDEVKDGMDIALCSLQGNILQYAGAHNPLWIIRNDEVMEIKADKQPIGKFEHPTPYTTHSLKLKKNDKIYIFSDGYVDQFGGEKGKKFKSKTFRELLLSIQSEPMEKQRTLINDAFETWRGNLDQVDDVCIIGVRI